MKILKIDVDVFIYGFEYNWGCLMKSYTTQNFEAMEFDGNLNLRYSDVTSLPDNLSVSGDLNLYKSEITSLPENLTVGGNLVIFHTKIRTLPDSLRVGGKILR